MNSKDRILRLLLDHVRPDADLDQEKLELLLSEENADVDWEEVQDLLGYSSLDALAFLKSFNKEFSTELTADDFMNFKGTSDFLALAD